MSFPILQPEPLLAVLLIFGTPLGVVWLGLRYKLKQTLATRASEAEVAVLREEVASLRDAVARLDDLEERFADMTLQLDDIAKAALPPAAASETEPGSKPRRRTD